MTCKCLIFGRSERRTNNNSAKESAYDLSSNLNVSQCKLVGVAQLPITTTNESDLSAISQNRV